MKWKAWTGREYLGAAALAGTLAVLATGAWMLQQGRATATGSAASDAAAFTVPAKGDAGAEDALPPFEPALAAADEDEAAAPAAPPSPAPTKLVVFVTGAVKRPGVYTSPLSGICCM